MLARRLWVMIVTVVALSGLVMGSVSAEGGQGVLATSGHAELTATPDTATVVAGVSVLSDTAAQAQAAVAAGMAGIRDSLKALGLPDRDIQTVQFRVAPEYNYVSGEQVLRGYRATHDIEIKVNELERLGEILDLVTTSGASQIRDISFRLRDATELQLKALQLAAQDARAKADALAAGAGVTVGKVVRIEDMSSNITPFRGDLGFAKAAMSAAETVIAVGEITVSASVRMEFAF